MSLRQSACNSALRIAIFLIFFAIQFSLFSPHYLFPVYSFCTENCSVVLFNSVRWKLRHMSQNINPLMLGWNFQKLSLTVEFSWPEYTRSPPFVNKYQWCSRVHLVRVQWVQVRLHLVRVWVQWVRVQVRVLKIKTRVRLEYTAGLEYYITDKYCT